MKDNDSKNKIVVLLSERYSEIKKEVLNVKKISGVDNEFLEITAEILGELLAKSVWLTTNVERSNNTFKISVNDTFSIQPLLDLGYKVVERVWNEGEISLLGDIVVIWPFSSNNILRLSLFGKKIEMIDILEVDSRRKLSSVSSRFLVDSSSELLFGGEEYPDICNISVAPNIGDQDGSIDMNIRKIPGIESYASRRAIEEIVRNYKNRGYAVWYVTNNFHRYEDDVEESFRENISDVFKVSSNWEKNIPRGFVSNVAKVLVLTDLEVLGEVDLSIYQLENRDLDPNSVAILKKIVPGDYVVHEDHGIGQYVDMTKKENGFYIQIAYAGKDRLYIPLSAASKLTKYIGAGKGKPILTGLNSGVWRRISQKARLRAEDIAKELLQLYALRETASGVKIFDTEGALDEFNTFVSKFEFKDTEDQILATKQLVDDFQREKPMDRLLVGDVGYGKTEIAMRAIFAVANAGYQVAVLAPTTVLVEQHISTFEKRFSDYPFRIASLSRFSTKNEKEEVLRDLEKGLVDILIGTHSLLSDEVVFKNLGLLVVDEEQKFGVKQKEKIKSRRVNSNVLSLTATPIPRTLNMALSGIRDISVLATPPSGRKSIINRFEKFHWESVEDAIAKELERGGQVYFLHNRVSTIITVYEKLVKMFPHSKVGIAHGQMSAEQLSSAMTKFIKGESEILVCTTIIENGLDISRVNTLIVQDSAMLGLSQMYQIRGRIGRSQTQAYAYFYYENLKGDAELRLEALKDSQELGAGFLLSNKDLEIRGAGDILGSNQSGAINSVGYGLYTQMLYEAVERLNLMGK